MSELFEEGIDGVHGLRKRERTRLWYRAMPEMLTVPDHLRIAVENAGLTVIAPDLVEAVRIHPVDLMPEHGTDVLVDLWPELRETHVLVEDGPAVTGAAVTSDERQERMRRRLGSQHNIVPAPTVPAATPEVGEALTDWRTVPVNAPTLMLAATELLDGRTPGPILGPGVSYRVLSAENGVVGLQVMSGESGLAIGYCNAVDLTCIEPMVVNLAGGGWKTSTKQRLRRVSQSLSHVTGSLIGTA